MSNVMSLKNLKNNVKRNGFDLSFKNAFTAKAGELLPVVCKPVLPGDKITIKPEWFTRTQPVNTAAYTRISEYYDAFFVPYRLLWRFFPDWIARAGNRSFAANSVAALQFNDRSPSITFNELKAVLRLFLVGSDSTNQSTYRNEQDFIKARNSGALKNQFGNSRFHTVAKLLSYLGYGRFSEDDMYDFLFAGERKDFYLPKRNVNSIMNLWPLLAYQKICQDYFRYDQWQESEPFLYNVDYMSGLNSSSSSTYLFDTTSIRQQVLGAGNNRYYSTMFDLQYCNWKKDYFTGVLPEAQYGDVATIGDSYDVEGDILGLENINEFSTSEGSINSFNVDSWPSRSLMTVLALRQAEATQKWREITQSGNQDYRTQMQKHWNVSPSPAMSSRCQYLDGWKSDIGINEVVNQTLNTDTDFADIAGKGTGAGRGYGSFEFDEHGIFMVIYHALPILDWSSIGVERHIYDVFNTDFPIPEFDSTGMQSTFLSEMIPANTAYGGSDAIIGYAPRYAHYKTSIDVVRGDFLTKEKSWVAPLGDRYLYEYLSSDRQGSVESYLDGSFFRVNPAVLDPIFGVSATDVISEENFSVAPDQFLCNAFFDIKVVRNLDYNGLPY